MLKSLQGSGDFEGIKITLNKIDKSLSNKIYGKNIDSVNLILGKNGSGKTKLIMSMINKAQSVYYTSSKFHKHHQSQIAELLSNLSRDSFYDASNILGKNKKIAFSEILDHYTYISDALGIKLRLKSNPEIKFYKDKNKKNDIKEADKVKNFPEDIFNEIKIFLNEVKEISLKEKGREVAAILYAIDFGFLFDNSMFNSKERQKTKIKKILSLLNSGLYSNLLKLLKLNQVNFNEIHGFNVDDITILSNCDKDMIEFLYENRFLDFNYQNISAGEAGIFHQLFNITHAIRELSKDGGCDIIIFIDEGDNSFHIELQCKYIKIICDNISKFVESIKKDEKDEFSIQLVFATHSPFLAMDVFKENISCLTKGETKVKKTKIVSQKLYTLDDEKKTIESEITYDAYEYTVKPAKFGFGASIHDLIRHSFGGSLFGEISKKQIKRIYKNSSDKGENGEDFTKSDNEAIYNSIGDNYIKHQLSQSNPNFNS